MTRDDYPEIQEYRFHFAALVYSDSLVNIDGATGVMHSITDSPTQVPTTHPEYAPLMQAAEQRRAELREAGITK